MTDVKLKIQPSHGKWKELRLEMIVDEGQVVLELHELQFSGSSKIKDPDTNKQERIEFTAPISTC